jgi:hypothetical protein
VSSIASDAIEHKAHSPILLSTFTSFMGKHGLIILSHVCCLDALLSPLSPGYAADPSIMIFIN